MRVAVENDLLPVTLVEGLTNSSLQMLINSLISFFSMSSRPFTASNSK